jgi:hypothetical protein
MRLIHVPNATQWRVGDVVIHDSDAKRADMLMVVIGCSRQGIYRTRYAFPEERPRAWRRKVWRNTVESLHDPARFGIGIPCPTVNQAGTASAPRPSASAQPQSGPTARS